MTKEFKIGAFVVTVLVISFFLINYLRGKDIFNREIEVVSRYDNIEGLVASAPVYIKGYKAGKVSEVVYDSDTEDFKVVCSISKDFRIPDDSRMTIYSVDIMGGKGVRIDLGTSMTEVQDGGVLASSFEAGLMDGLSDGVAPLLSKVTSTLDSLSLTVSSVNKLLSDENVNGIGRTISHLEHTMADVRKLSGLVEGKSGELDSLMENLSLLSDRFVSISDKLDTAMTDVTEIASTVSEAELSELVSSFKALVENINDPDGSIGKLLVDGSVYDSLDALLSDVDELVRKIQENPKKYLRISVF